MAQIAVNGVGMDFGGRPVLRNVTFSVAPGERWGVVGRNGSGKTTVLRLVAGALQPTAGSVARAPGLTASVLDQHR